MENKQQQHNKRVEVIKNLVKEYYKGKKSLSFRKAWDPTHHLDTISITIDYSIMVVIPYGETWENLRKRIDKSLIRQYQSKECIICLKKNPQQISNCNQCHNYWCSKCYINMYKNNNGIMKCPYCRNQWGSYIPDFLIPLGVKEIQSKLKSWERNYKLSLVEKFKTDNPDAYRSILERCVKEYFSREN